MRLALALLLSPLLAQQPNESTTGDAQKVVTLREIKVEGSRLPAASVIRLAQLNTGHRFNFAQLRAALQQAAASGLLRNIDFEYESIPGRETDVVLVLKCTDEPPTARASIQIAKVVEDDIWQWLAQQDPLFTRDMPPTEPAIRLYADRISQYMETHGVPDFRQHYDIVADATSAKGAGETADRLVFRPARRRVK